ncbi:hypothetical protein PBRA_007149 [Plasmodiophora brassicae]|uniref:Uncharacterized protein n=1 Tax=Plasmodiophora brassicae TaxID=37360 RepID=A0A0G4IUT3_PLABS|nr:hypothetical protein PBRA_007149 [Plasmodiophora brassicae]
MSAAKSAELGKDMSTANVPESEWVSRKLVVPAAPSLSRAYDSTRCETSKFDGGCTISTRTGCDPRGWHTGASGSRGQRLVAGERGHRQGMDREPVHCAVQTDGQECSPAYRSIDAAYNVGDGALLPSVIYTLTAQWDWDSLLMAPTFLGGYTLFRDVKYSEVAHCIIDVRLLKRANQPSIQIFGWTVLQLFDDDGYTNMGSFQLPLFKGLPDPDILEMMRAEPFANVIKREMSKEGNKKRKAAKKPLFEFLEPSSAMVRIADSLLEDLAPAKLSWLRPGPGEQGWHFWPEAAEALEPHVDGRPVRC